jgi:hypothetical protein
VMSEVFLAAFRNRRRHDTGRDDARPTAPTRQTIMPSVSTDPRSVAVSGRGHHIVGTMANRPDPAAGAPAGLPSPGARGRAMTLRLAR